MTIRGQIWWDLARFWLWYPYVESYIDICFLPLTSLHMFCIIIEFTLSKASKRLLRINLCDIPIFDQTLLLKTYNVLNIFKANVSIMDLHENHAADSCTYSIWYCVLMCNECNNKSPKRNTGYGIGTTLFFLC